MVDEESKQNNGEELDPARKANKNKSKQKIDESKPIFSNVANLKSMVPKLMVPRLCGYCEGAVDSIISVFTQLYSPGFHLEFETLCESIWHVVADLWQGKGKISGCSKTNVLLFSSDVKVSFQRKYSGIALEFSRQFLKDRKCSLMNRKHCQHFKIIIKNFNTTPRSFL